MANTFGNGSALAALLLCVSCGATRDLPGVDAINGGFSTGLTASEEVGLLAFVNSCNTTRSLLDDDARLDARAAQNIIAHRDGPDGVCGGADDDPFDNLAELDGIPWVGEVALTRMVAHANLLGYIDFVSQDYEGVSFTSDDANGVLSVVNGASLEILDVDIGLDVRAAQAIVATRPYDEPRMTTNMEKLAATPYVGQTALRKLKDFVSRWNQCTNAGETVEGVVFSALDVHDVLDLVNQGTASHLMAIPGIGSVLAERIDSSRPHENVARIGNVSGLGASALASLRDGVGVRWCSRPGSRCGCAADVSYRPPLLSFDENNLYYFLAYGHPWDAERVVDSGFIDHDGTQVVLIDVSVADDPADWQQIVVQVFDRLWDCCLRYQFSGQPLEIGRSRKGVLHLGRIINAQDDKTYVLAYWQDADDASFGWLYERDSQGTWAQVGEVFLN